MIDLHGHYLPWVDDGAQSLEEGLLMLQMAEADGVRLIVVTPKVEPGRWNNDRVSLRKKFDAFARIAQKRGIAIELRLGAQAMHSAETLAWIERGEVPVIGHWNERPVVLMRWREDFIPIGAINAVQRLLSRGILPMLAHPERNAGVIRSPGALDFFLRDACLIQIDAGSVLGWHGDAVRDTAFHLIEAGWATVMASGAHNASERPPMLGRARQILVERFGEATAQRLTETNPGRLTQSDPVADVPVLRDALEPAAPRVRLVPAESTTIDAEIPVLGTSERIVERRPRLRVSRWSRQAPTHEANVPTLRL